MQTSGFPMNALGVAVVTDPKLAHQMNLENAIKLYLASKGTLLPVDISTNVAEPRIVPKHGQQPSRKKHRADVVHHLQCPLTDGCVTLDKKKNFLLNKYIPGNENVLSPYFVDSGGMFHAGEDDEKTNKDFMHYIMSRPKKAVPSNIRKLLMPEGDNAWPGGNGEDRSSYYPKDLSPKQVFWELDIEPAPGANYLEDQRPAGHLYSGPSVHLRGHPMQQESITTMGNPDGFQQQGIVNGNYGR
eukprot:CAMPEP_0196570448 /NCGR_PEP_ID=MMETSP1081-20130531/534_1 /TAXON_ID=36882 /ORGANISM="Pyramimonas amylifera, Strain CCMP720" /LENGTH=242 /DNA_ID=CAMNT_0041886895 /DNA_START=223 /DNA_END=951 /DNA_ORIENTATION=+